MMPSLLDHSAKYSTIGITRISLNDAGVTPTQPGYVRTMSGDEFGRQSYTKYDILLCEKCE